MSVLLLALLAGCGARRAAEAPPAAPAPAATPPPEAPAGLALAISLADPRQATALELTCPGGYRQRVAVAGGPAVFQGVPEEACTLHFKGITPARFGPIAPGTGALVCQVVATTGVCAADLDALKAAIPEGLR